MSNLSITTLQLLYVLVYQFINDEKTQLSREMLRFFNNLVWYGSEYFHEERNFDEDKNAFQ